MLSEKQILELQRPFAFAEHGFNQKNPYILKSAIRARLNRLTPGWQLLQPELVAVDGDVVVMRGGLQIGDVKRYGVGTGIILRADSDGAIFNGAKLAGMIAKAYKSAASDILPRAALEFGMGEYLKDKPKNINKDNFAEWLVKISAPPTDPNAWTAENVALWEKKWLAKDMTEAQLFKALGITSLYREFKGTVAAADTAVEAYLKLAEFDKPAQPMSLSPVLDCRPWLLEEGDLIYQCTKDDHGPVTTRLKVIHNWGKVGNNYKLVLQNVATEVEITVMWGGIDVTLYDGPKVEAFKKDSSLCGKAKIGCYPEWLGQFAATG